MNIVWVDDDQDFLNSVKQVLSQHVNVFTFVECYEFEEWIDNEGKSFFTEGLIDCVVLDFMFETDLAYRMNTSSLELDIPKLLRIEINYNGPIFMCTNYDLEDDSYINQYTNGIIEKRPINIHELKAIIKQTNKQR